MSDPTSHSSRKGRIGELALWSTAGVIMLTAHLGAAAALLRQDPLPAADMGPPAAIMIELAAEPEAANTEEDQVAEDQLDAEEVASKQLEPVETPPEPTPEPPPEPVEEPPPEEVVEPVEPEPEPVQPPEPEIAEPLPEPPPEPVEEVDPLEQEMLAALENVEVPLPVTRPSPPPPPKKEPPKRAKQQPQASREAREAKLQTKQANRTAASRTSEGSAAPSVSPAGWMSKVRSRIVRNARRCPGGEGTAAIRFTFDNSGNITGVSLSRSSGSSQTDDYLVSAVQRSSPIPAPPAGATRQLTQPITCTR